MDWNVILTGAISLIGGGFAKAGLDHWAKIKSQRLELEGKAQEAEIRGEDTARHFLQGLATEERKSHKECLQRVAAIESAMFRQQDQHQREAERQNATIERLTADNARLLEQCGVMREALLASFVGDISTARTMLDSLPPPRPPLSLAKVK